MSLTSAAVENLKRFRCNAGDATGQMHTGIIDSQGRLYMCGRNDRGQLGNGTTTNSSTPILANNYSQFAGKSFVEVSTGGYHTLVLCTDGTVFAFGWNHRGQLGNNSTTDSSVPVAINSFGDLVGKTPIRVHAHGIFSSIICSDGTLCMFGSNEDGNLGNNTTTNSLVPIAINSFGALVGKTPVQVDAGLDFMVVLCSDGTLLGCGQNNHYQYGIGTTTTQQVLTTMNSFGDLVGRTPIYIACSYTNTAVICSDGSLCMMGQNNERQIGDGTTNYATVPIRINNFGSLNGRTPYFIRIGFYYMIALCTDNTIHAWGRPKIGSSLTTPTLITQTNALVGKTVVCVTQYADNNSNASNILYLCSDGSVVGYGTNSNGELGLGNTNSTPNPTLLPYTMTVSTPAPAVTTAPITDITSYTAIGGGNVITDSGDAVTARGVVWNTSTDPTIILSTQTSDGTGTGAFISQLTNLRPLTTYFVRAYATNSQGTGYGSNVFLSTLGFPRDSFSTIISPLKPGTTYYVRSYATTGGNQTGYGNTSTFTTLAGPATITAYPTVASEGSATFQALLETGGDPVTVRGFCWDIRPSPTLDLTTKVEEAGSFSNGTFTLVGSGFDTDTTYHVRAYAVNSYGTSYSNEYMLTSGYYYLSTHTFTNAGALTRTGPTYSMCLQEYASSAGNWIYNDQFFTMSNLGTQVWRVPATGNYVIDAYGAQGGSAFDGNVGGLGARSKGTFYLSSGTWANIVVGQQGGQGVLNSQASGGGGGGSFVWVDTTQPLVAAGGGGGRGGTAQGAPGNGLATTNGGTIIGAGGTGGNSGSSGGSCGGAGGAGWLTGSASYSCNGGGTEQTPVGGQTRTGGFIGGGAGFGVGAQGGFGGGGGTAYGGGGGGGYSGGGGGNSSGYGGGGGGSSNSGLNPTLTAGVETGQGQVVVQWLPPPALSTLGASSIGQYQVFGGGQFLYIPGSMAGLAGIVWDSNTNPGIELGTKTFQTGTFSTGSYYLAISSLLGGTAYYARPFAYTNQSTLGYGPSVLFSTLNSPPHVSTLAATNISGGASAVTGQIVGTGGLSVTVRGAVWDLNSTPTIALSTQTAEVGFFGAETFLTSATSLSESSSYYIRAYAINSLGLTYGNELVITAMLYNFTTFIFTNATATGRNGPTLSQCRTAYSSQSWTQNAAYLNMTTQGIQLWTVPKTGTYIIEAVGARGGNGAGRAGGLGAYMSGTFSLTQGEVIKILVGQLGGSRTGTDSNSAGAGGGGTFVVKNDNTPMVVAGGGGGAGQSTNGGAGQTTLNGQSGLGGSSGQGGINGGGGGGAQNGTAGTQSVAGGTGSSCSYGAGGGGFYTRGGYNCSGSAPLINGGSFLTENGVGGQSDTGRSGAEGGFGCGAGVGHRASAGGGWSGGGGDGSSSGGGGGGSYNVGLNQTNISGFNGGDGYVIITLAGNTSIVPLAGLALWLDASDSSTLFTGGSGTTPATTNGTTITRWADKSGYGTDFTNFSGANVPTLEVAQVNGLNSIFFSVDYLVRQMTWSINEMTIIFVTQETAHNGGANGYISWKPPSGNDWNASGGLALHESGPPICFAVVSSSAGQLNEPDNPSTNNSLKVRVYGRSVSGSTAYLYRSNTLIASTTSTSSAVNSLAISIGARFEGVADNSFIPKTANNTFTGRMCEILMYNRSLSSTERTNVVNYLVSKWNITT